MMALSERILDKFGSYALLERIGQGSMGVLYKAYDEKHHRYVALKTMPNEKHADPDLRKRFYREARLAAALIHPNIIRIYDYGEIEGQIYLAMELLKGTDLKTIIQDEIKDIPLRSKLDWMRQLCNVIGFAHQNKVIHRDIKPSNIFLRGNGQVVVTDFGVAHIPSSDITKKGVILGTPDYISPEQILTVHYDHRADIFALGLVFYELLTGIHPFRSPNLPATVHKILNEKPTPPHDVDARIPPKLSEIVMRAIEKDVNQRYHDCGAILRDLDVFLGDSSGL